MLESHNFDLRVLFHLGSGDGVHAFVHIDVGEQKLYKNPPCRVRNSQGNETQMHMTFIKIRLNRYAVISEIELNLIEPGVITHLIVEHGVLAVSKLISCHLCFTKQNSNKSPFQHLVNGISMKSLPKCR